MSLLFNLTSFKCCFFLGIINTNVFLNALWLARCGDALPRHSSLDGSLGPFSRCCQIKIQQRKHPNSSHQGRAPNRAFHSRCQSDMTLLLPSFLKSQYFDWGCLGPVRVHPVFPAANLARRYIYPRSDSTETFVGFLPKWFFVLFCLKHQFCSLFNGIMFNYKPNRPQSSVSHGWTNLNY